MSVPEALVYSILHHFAQLGRINPEDRFCHFFVVPTKFVRSGKMLENRACPNLDAMSVPEALVYSILHHFAQLSRIKHP